MKTHRILFFLTATACILTGCAKAGAVDTTISGPVQSAATEESTGSAASSDGNVLIAYFSRYGNIDSEHEIDAVSSASIQVKDGEMMGNMEYIAHLVQENVGGDLHFIETAKKYHSHYDNTDSNELDLQAEQE